jgi:hypothetical protein
LPDFDAPQQRDGSPFANRITSVGFDFAGDSVALTGSFGSSLAGQVVIGRDLPTNPFKHRYHPDHDDKGPDFLPLGNDMPPDRQEVWTVTRDLQLTFAPVATGDLSPGSGYAQRTGTYREAITASIGTE